MDYDTFFIFLLIIPTIVAYLNAKDEKGADKVLAILGGFFFTFAFMIMAAQLFTGDFSDHDDQDCGDMPDVCYGTR